MKTAIKVGSKTIHLDAQFVENLNNLRKDANDMNSLVFFERQLEFILQEIFKVEYPNRKIANGLILPITSRAGNAAKTYTYTMIDRVGQAKIINSYGKDWKRITLKGKQVTITIKPIGDSYAFNFQDIRSAQMAGMNLESETAMAAREAIDDLKELIGFFGDADAGLQGFNVIIETYGTEYIVPPDGTGSSKLFSTKDADKILRDMNALVSVIISVTNEKEYPDTLLLPVKQYTQIATQRVPDTETTTLKFFLGTQRAANWVQNVIPYYNLTKAGDGATDRMVAYKNSPDKIHYEMPVILEQIAGNQTGIESEYHLHSRNAGIIVIRPLSIAYGDGI